MNTRSTLEWHDDGSFPIFNHEEIEGYTPPFYLLYENTDTNFAHPLVHLSFQFVKKYPSHYSDISIEFKDYSNTKNEFLEKFFPGYNFSDRWFILTEPTYNTYHLWQHTERIKAYLALRFPEDTVDLPKSRKFFCHSFLAQLNISPEMVHFFQLIHEQQAQLAISSISISSISPNLSIAILDCIECKTLNLEKLDLPLPYKKFLLMMQHSLSLQIPGEIRHHKRIDKLITEYNKIQKKRASNYFSLLANFARAERTDFISPNPVAKGRI